MYARTTTVHGDPQRVDDGIAHVRDRVMPAVLDMDGCVGMSMLADRASGRCIVTAAWADEAAMRASAEGVKTMREQARQVMGGEMEVQEWEIAVMHRMHEAHNGACTRVIYGSIDADRLDDAVGTMRMSVLPKLEDLPGFCAVSHMIDRETGRSSTAVTYDSRADMAAAHDQAKALREEFAGGVGMEITGIAEFDLVLAHLRVPEMA
jgi:quinol monooxygenase YgiN